MAKRRLKTWDKFFLAVVLLVLLVEFGIGEIENFYFTFNMYDKTNLTSLK
jgi:hypothetical protein